MSDRLTVEEAASLIAMLDRPYEEYWPALGRFIHTFSQVESLLQGLVHHFAGLEDNIGKAIAHGLRAKNAQEMIGRILEATGREEVKDRLARPFHQLGEISRVRNDIVHWGAKQRHGALCLSSERMAYTPDKLTSYPISADSLREMAEDLTLISTLLLIEKLGPEAPDVFEPGYLSEVRAKPWRYKPPPRSPSSKKPAKPQPPQGRAPRRPASRG